MAPKEEPPRSEIDEWMAEFINSIKWCHKKLIKKMVLERPDVKDLLKESYSDYPTNLLDDCLSTISIMERMLYDEFDGIYYQIFESHIPICEKLYSSWKKYVIDSKSLKKVFHGPDAVYYLVSLSETQILWREPHGARLLKIDHFDHIYFTSVGKFFEHYVEASVHKVQSRMEKRKRLREERVAYDDRIEKSLKRKQKREDAKALREGREPVQASFWPAGYNDDIVPVVPLPPLFHQMKFYIGYNAPVESLAFVIKHSGGEVVYNPMDGNHQLFASPPTDRSPDRIYIHFKWIYDCVNNGSRLPVEPYYEETSVPPHPCPFSKYEMNRSRIGKWCKHVVKKTAGKEGEAVLKGMADKEDEGKEKNESVEEGSIRIKDQKGKAVVKGKSQSPEKGSKRIKGQKRTEKGMADTEDEGKGKNESLEGGSIRIKGKKRKAVVKVMADTEDEGEGKSQSPEKGKGDERKRRRRRSKKAGSEECSGQEKGNGEDD